MSVADLEARLQLLAKAFRTRALAEARELEELLASGLTPPALARMQQVAHRLAGGATTFGLHGVSAPAAALEAEILHGGAKVRETALALIAAIGTTRDSD